MFNFRVVCWALFLALGSTCATTAQEATPHHIVPLGHVQPEKVIESLWGDYEKPGAPYVIRIHNEAGYVVLPHTHPEDENIVVVKGSWSLAMGPRFSRSALEPLEVGAYGFVPKKMTHFGRSKTATTIQVHGIGPFSTDWVDAVYELTEATVSVLTSGEKPARPVESAPPGCFALTIGTRVRGSYGEGAVIGALCSPSNKLTQYRVQKDDGERFWATLEELNKL